MKILTGQMIDRVCLSGVISFKNDGTFSYNRLAAISHSKPTDSDSVNITLDFSGMTQYGSDHDAAVEIQDGYKKKVLEKDYQ